MDNRTRAENIITHGLKNGDSPARIARHLADYGLITPDLPESHREVALHTPEWFLDGPISLVVSDPSEGVVSYGSDVHNGAFRLVLTKEEAEGIALALLAAANHREEA